MEHRPDLHAELQAIFSTQPAEHWLTTFCGLGIPCGAINEVDEILNDPHVLERGMVVGMEHPTAAIFCGLATPCTFPIHRPATACRRPPSASTRMRFYGIWDIVPNKLPRCDRWGREWKGDIVNLVLNY